VPPNTFTLANQPIAPPVTAATGPALMSRRCPSSPWAIETCGRRRPRVEPLLVAEIAVSSDNVGAGREAPPYRNYMALWKTESQAEHEPVAKRALWKGIPDN
jgi:hypothetical protein